MSRCIATTKQNKQCKNAAKPGSEYCNIHQQDTFCTGITQKKEACRAQRLKGSLFCGKHQNQNEKCCVSTDCSVFRYENILSLRRTAVLDYHNSMDAYTGEHISAINTPNLDHIVELHMIRDCFDQVPGTFEQKKPLFSLLRSTVNRVQNLNFTSERLNQSKHCAVKSFCDDFAAKRCHIDGLRFYLSNKKFSVDIGANIIDQTKASLDYITPFLIDHEEMVGNVFSMMEKLDL